MSEPKPVPLRIKVPYADADAFASGWKGRLTRGGVFIATEQPRPLGTRVAFEFVLADGSRVLRGTGEVAQIVASGPRAGMTVRFAALDESSRGFIAKLPDLLVSTPPGGWRPTSGTPTPLLGLPTVQLADQRARPSPDDPVLGIHFGTTRAGVAVATPTKTEIVLLDGRQPTLPACVHADEKGRLAVGQRAAAHRLDDPHNTAFGIKRILGKRAASARLKALAEKVPFRIVASPEGEAAVLLRGNVVPATQLAALVIATLRDRAQEHLGRPIARAVIGVPAHFDDGQRQAIRFAGAMAGLVVERVVNEPTAAANQFGYAERVKAGRRVLVYSLGGGAFDASVLEVTSDMYEVVATGGDSFLGGHDFDQRLAEHLGHRFEKMVGDALADDATARQRVLDAAESAKIALSDREEARVSLRALPTRRGKIADLDVTVRRGELADLSADLVARTLKIVDGVLASRELVRDDVRDIILVGGQTRMPLVRQMLTQAFGASPRHEQPAEQVVALGAAQIAREMLLKQVGGAKSAG